MSVTVVAPLPQERNRRSGVPERDKKGTEADACCFSDHPNSTDEAAALDQWRAAGGSRVVEHWREYTGLVSSIGPLIDGKAYAEAAMAAQVAANYAVLWHPGIFADPQLEWLLRRIGQAALPFEATPAQEPGDLSHGMSVLHVATELDAIGGHTRMLSRWIRNDSGNVHSLALTRQNTPIPAWLPGTVAATGGCLRRLNLTPGGIMEWARALQPLMAKADLVVLHVHNMDIIPMLALAGMKQRPRTILLNHADHLFWLGVDFIDQVVSTRRSGLALNIGRRRIAATRNLLLPLCLEPQVRSLSREEAKRQLGLPPDYVVLLTVARALKFRPVGDIGFADILVPVLRMNPNARLIAVGPGGTVDWSTAEAQVPGQIQVIRQTPDTRVYLEAADIYVDSLPFISITSLFEAGLHGLPLVTRNPFGEGCAIMGADSPGLDRVILRAGNIEDFREILTRLIRADHLRRKIGERTAAEIEAVNIGEGWKKQLRSLYRQIFSLPRTRHRPVSDPGPRLEDVDRLLPPVFGPIGCGDTALSRTVRSVEPVLKAAPLGWKLRTLASFAKQGRLKLFTTPVWRLLIPEWLTANIRILLPGRIKPGTSRTQRAAAIQESARDTAPVGHERGQGLR